MQRTTKLLIGLGLAAAVAVVATKGKGEKKDTGEQVEPSGDESIPELEGGEPDVRLDTLGQVASPSSVSNGFIGEYNRLFVDMMGDIGSNLAALPAGDV